DRALARTRDRDRGPGDAGHRDAAALAPRLLRRLPLSRHRALVSAALLPGRARLPGPGARLPGADLPGAPGHADAARELGLASAGGPPAPPRALCGGRLPRGTRG